MRLARLDLLRQRMDVAEAALERRAEEDRRGAGGLVDPVRRLLGLVDGLGAGEPHPGAVGRADRLDVVGAAMHVLQDLDQPGARRADVGLAARHVGLDAGIVGEPREIARRLGGGELDEGVEHGARDAERHRRHAAGIEALHGEGIERAPVAAQGRILARAGEGLRHEDVGARNSLRTPCRACRACASRGSACVSALGMRTVRTVGRPKRLQAQRAVGLHDVAVRADPGGLAVAGGEMPFAGDAVAARRGDQLVLVGRTPGDQAARIAVDRARRLERNEGRDQGRAVGRRTCSSPASRRGARSPRSRRHRPRARLPRRPASAAAAGGTAANSCNSLISGSGKSWRFSISSATAEIAGPSARARTTGSGRRVERPTSFMGEAIGPAATTNCQWRSPRDASRGGCRFTPSGRRILVEQRPRNVAASRWLTSATQPSEDTMTKTILIALVCAASTVSLAQAQTSGSVGVGASGGVGAGGSQGTTSGGASGGISGGGSVVTPPASAGAGVSGGASGGATVNQPAIDTNQAQQPGVGVNSGASGGGSIPRPGR